MNILQVLKSLADILYEVMSWLVFYPITLWKALRHPITSMDYVSAQLAKGAKAPFSEALSPPIFLLLTVLFSHVVELAMVGESSLVADTHGLAGLVKDDISLVVMRLLAFATFPVIVATHLVRMEGSQLNRETLQSPFFSQCYATAPTALAFSLAATFAQFGHQWAQWVALALIAAATVAWLAVETLWFEKRLSISLSRAFGNALLAYVQCLAVLILLTWLLGGTGL